MKHLIGKTIKNLKYEELPLGHNKGDCHLIIEFTDGTTLEVVSNSRQSTGCIDLYKNDVLIMRG